MAFQGKTIHNPKNGQSITFLQTTKDSGGALLEMEAAYEGHSKEPPPHYHPLQEEFFKILEGAMTVRINGQLRVLEKGDTLHVPAGLVHSMWNHTDAPLVLNRKVLSQQLPGGRLSHARYEQKNRATPEFLRDGSA